MWSRFLPSNAQESGKCIFILEGRGSRADGEPLGIVIGLRLVSSTASTSLLFTIGKLIDYFSTMNPVCLVLVSALSTALVPLRARAHA